MKKSSVGAVGALILAGVLVWLAWQGFHIISWRVRYMMPAFIAGALVGGALVALVTRRRR